MTRDQKLDLTVIIEGKTRNVYDLKVLELQFVIMDLKNRGLKLNYYGKLKADLLQSLVEVIFF